MILRLTFKTPDVLGDAIEEALQNLPDYEFEHRRRQIEQSARQWIRYGEYVTIEIDIEQRTARVVPCHE